MSWNAAPSTLDRLTRQSLPGKAAPTLSEVFAGAVSDASAVGFVLSQLPASGGPVLWVQDRVSRSESGRPYMPGLPQISVLRVEVGRPADVLWAMEEGLRCSALRGVIGEVWGDAAAVNFTASKRLAMRAEAVGVPCWLLRRAASADLSAARDRWRVGAVPSRVLQSDPAAPGMAQWRVELFRSRRAKPGVWVASYDGTTCRVDRAAEPADGAVPAGNVGPGLRAAR